MWIQHSLLFLYVIPKPHQTDYRQDRDDGGGNGVNVDMILCTAQGAQVEGGVDPTKFCGNYYKFLKAPNSTATLLNRSLT